MSGPRAKQKARLSVIWPREPWWRFYNQRKSKDIDIQFLRSLSPSFGKSETTGLYAERQKADDAENRS